MFFLCFSAEEYLVEEVLGSLLAESLFEYVCGDSALCDEVRTYEKAKAWAILIGAFFKNHYQLLWAVHKKKRGESLFHVHFIMNTVSFVDGKLYNSSRAHLTDFCKYVERVTGSPCRYYFSDPRTSDDV